MKHDRDCLGISEVEFVDLPPALHNMMCNSDTRESDTRRQSLETHSSPRWQRKELPDVSVHESMSGGEISLVEVWIGDQISVWQPTGSLTTGYQSHALIVYL